MYKLFYVCAPMVVLLGVTPNTEEMQQSPVPAEIEAIEPVSLVQPLMSTEVESQPAAGDIQPSEPASLMEPGGSSEVDAESAAIQLSQPVASSNISRVRRRATKRGNPDNQQDVAIDGKLHANCY